MNGQKTGYCVFSDEQYMGENRVLQERKYMGEYGDSFPALFLHLQTWYDPGKIGKLFRNRSDYKKNLKYLCVLYCYRFV